MGWVWIDDESQEPRSSDRSLGFGAISDVGNLNTDLKSDGGDRCSTHRIVKSQCKTEEVEPGKFFRRCEKTEQLLRDCVGRPVEVVESSTEYTEDDVTEDVARGSRPFESSAVEPFSFPGLRSDIEAIERSMIGGLSHFFEAAEEMKNGFYQVFGKPMEPPPFNRQRSRDGIFEEASNKSSDSPYAEFSGRVKDV